MPPMRRTLLLLLALVACGGDEKKPPDAAPPIDAAIDAPPPKPSCMTYCTQVQANCTGAQAQYPTMDQCMGTCATFPVGTLADTTGNTLGCRQYHSGAPSQSAPMTHCYHAGP